MTILIFAITLCCRLMFLLSPYPRPADDRCSIGIALLLAGCTSSQSLSRLNIYLVSLSYQINGDSPDAPHHPLVNPSLAGSLKSMTNATSLEVRTGYFALCFRQSGEEWTCGDDPSTLTKQFHPDDDPFNLIWQTADFKDTIVFYGLMWVSHLRCRGDMNLH